MGDLEAKLRKAQRQMLRSIFQKGRKRQSQVASLDGVSQDSAESGDVELVQEVEGEELEPWHEWIRRVTKEIEF